MIPLVTSGAQAGTAPSGVPKVVEEEKTAKYPKAARDSKNYEKTDRTRKFAVKWQVGWPWQQHDHGKGMI